VIRGGGKENFKQMKEFYSSQAFVDYVTDAQAASIASFEQEMPDVRTEEETPAGTAATLDQATLLSLKATGKTNGDENADITILEFADVNCGYCKRQIAQSRTIQTIMDAYPNVNMIYKNMPVLGSYEPAYVMECFGADSSVEDYYTFVEEVYGSSNSNIENLLNIATLL